ncbi:DHH family protein [Xylariomycetidae sp. FL0641]|nr:DHH family protein [Xylariomycetidae sp. FL0641]
MKRSAEGSPKPTSRAKKARVEVPQYHLTPSVLDEFGDAIWPAPKDQIQGARDFIKDVKAKKKTLIVPDKDADGLTSGAILQKTLVLLGLPEDQIQAHILQKAHTIHDESERSVMQDHQPAFIFILDQGSRKSGPVIDTPHKALVIDHHWALDDDFPANAQHVTACNSPPVATSSLLTYHICSALHPSVAEDCAWLCAVGTYGDLGNALKWEAPFPDMRATFKAHTKKAIQAAVSLLNAPRRTAAYDVPGAWAALVAANDSPAALLANATLRAARAEVNAEVARCARAPPRFSADGAVAVVRISSPAQVHPVIATRWAGTLASPRLRVVLAANDGYLPGRVNFSCRVPRCARGDDSPPVDIIATLRALADRAADPTLRARLGESFARGHKEASGGIVPVAEFEELMAVLQVGGGKKDGVPKDTGSPQKKPIQNGEATQANTLMNYFGKKEVA